MIERESNHPLEPCRPADVGLEIGEAVSPELSAAVEGYFAQFARPDYRPGTEPGRRRTYCVGCGSEFDALREAIGIGAAHRWGLVHGEASCTSCGWPSRGHHQIRDAAGDEVATISNLFLQYLPEEDGE